MQPVVVSSARRQDLWEAGGVAIEVGAVEGMVAVAVERMVVVAVEGMELCPPGRSQNAYHMGVSARLIIDPPPQNRITLEIFIMRLATASAKGVP